MSWFSAGFDEAERMAERRTRKANRSFWTKPEETAVVRFLSPAKDTFNIKRAFIRESRGQKYFTSPMVDPDPFVQAGYNLQSTFVWKVLDRRVLEFTDRSGQDQKVGPRVLYFAVGQRDRKALQAFESQMLADYNEYLKDEDRPVVALEEHNITSFDIRVSKPRGSGWQFVAVRGGEPKKLSSGDKSFIADNDFSLEEELAPLPLEEIHSILGTVRQADSDSDTGTEYSYDPEEAEVPTFFGA